VRNDTDDHSGIGGTAGDHGDRLSASTRVEAFSDGVLAIAITLLVLNLHAPSQSAGTLSELASQWPAYLAYLASFGYIGVIWVNHHQLFTRIAAVDLGLLWRNLVLLLGVSVLATHERLLAQHTRASFFAAERRRALLGLIAYLLAAAAVLWQPLASLVILCVLPIFYGATSEGWSRHKKV
jgi:uncharacterized membrane protein